MSQQVQTNTPLSMNLDKAFKHLSDTEAFYLLNHERFLNIHGKDGATLGKTTPLVANYQACDIDQPQGENYCIGAYRSPITNEVYTWHYNSYGAHYILRISNTGCEVVYYGNCLELSADPKHSIESWRAYLKVDITCKNQHGKQLIFTDGLHDIYQIDVEASIATENFTTPFFDLCGDNCDTIKMCVPYPAEPITATPQPIDPAQVHLTNRLLDKGFKFIYQWEYYDGRKSEWSHRSSLYFIDSGGCFDSSEGLSRCFNLRVPFGNPMVSKIHIAFSDNNGLTWQKYDTVEKYKKYNDNQQKWYERGLSEEITDVGYSAQECVFQYTFCNDRQTQAIDPAELKRVYNPMPREAQGLIPVKNALGFYNYKSGACPIESKEVSKLIVEEVCKPATSCTTQYVTVVVRAVVHNFSQSMNQPVYTLEAATADSNHLVRFGGFNKNKDIGTSTSARPETGFGQEFKDGKKNFNVYIDGTNYWMEMEQWKVNNGNFSSKTKVGVVDDMGDGKRARRLSNDIRERDYFFQEAHIKVPKGTKGFLRLTSHEAKNNEQSTSTYVAGRLQDIRHYKGDRLGAMVWNEEEIFFDTCDATDTLELYQAFVIQDNAVDSGLASPAIAFCGYLKDASGRPIEGAVIAPILDNSVMKDVVSSQTDHNGFWHMYFVITENKVWETRQMERLIKNNNTRGSTFAVLMEQDGGQFLSVKTFSVNGMKGSMTRSDQIVESNDIRDGYYCKVRVRVLDCDSKPVAGIRVSMSGTRYEVTGATGYADFVVRNYYEGQRRVRYVVLDPNGCFTLSCANQCNPCFPSEDMLLPDTFPKTVVTRDFPNPAFLNKYISSGDNRGLKHGGRYGWGIVLRGLCSRVSAVNLINYSDVKKVQERGKTDYCDWRLKLKNSSNPAYFPVWADYLEIVRTENLNGFELQWIVDKKEYVPNGRVKFTIQSLNDYNSSHLFKTNTKYQFLTGDRVEFIRNGDGKIIDAKVKGIMNYSILSPFHDKDVSGVDEAEVDYFNQIVLDNDGRLDDIKEGAIIELQRPRDLSESPIFYSIGISVPLDKQLVGSNWVSVLGSPVDFKSFDTFLVNRKMDKFAVQEFEHHSPSDFWEVKMDDRGLGYVLNEFEDERRWGRRITINAPLQYNYFGDMVKTFDAPEQGDIVSMGIWAGKVMLAICERGNAMAQVADDLLRVGGDGTIRAASGNQIISNLQPEVSGQFGCQYPHIGSIYYGDGFATWADVGRLCYVMHDLQKATDVSTGRVGTHFRRRFPEMESFNAKQVDVLNMLRFSTGINNSTGALYLTQKALRDSGINNQPKALVQQNDTIVFHPMENDWLGYASFTPEMYSYLDFNDEDQCAFITFMRGIPYIHPVISDKFNEFYGVAVDRVIGFSINKFNDKIKRPVSIEIEDQTMWFAKEVTTDKANFLSEIPPIRMKKTEDKWNAAFLGNKLGRDGLYGDEGARGYFVNVVLIRDNTDNLKYNSNDNTKRTKYDELDIILTKFTLSEGSGYTGNI